MSTILEMPSDNQEVRIPMNDGTCTILDNYSLRRSFSTYQIPEENVVPEQVGFENGLVSALCKSIQGQYWLYMIIKLDGDTYYKNSVLMSLSDFETNILSGYYKTPIKFSEFIEKNNISSWKIIR